MSEDAQRSGAESIALIPFTAAEGRTGPLTWSQRGWLSRVNGEKVEPASMFTARWVTARCTTDQAVESIRGLVRRFEALRTEITGLNPCQAHQFTVANGEIPVAMYSLDAGSTLTPATKAAAMAENLRQSFSVSPTNSSPIAFALLHADDMVHAIAFAASYFAVDTTAADLLARFVENTVNGVPLSVSPSEEWTPIDQALYEQSPQGLRQSARAVEHWRACFEQAQASLFPEQLVAYDEPRFAEFEMDSPALTGALSRLTSIYPFTEPALALTATSLALRDLCRVDRVRLELIFNNRWGSRTQNTIGNIAQNAVYSADLANCDFARAAAIVAEESFKAQRFSHHDPVVVDGMFSELAGKGIERSEFFSFSATPVVSDSPAPSAIDADIGPDTTTIRQLKRTESGGTKFFLSIERDTVGRRYRLFANLNYLPEAAAETMLHTVERIAVSAAAA